MIGLLKRRKLINQSGYSNAASETKSRQVVYKGQPFSALVYLPEMVTYLHRSIDFLTTTGASLLNMANPLVPTGPTISDLYNAFHNSVLRDVNEVIKSRKENHLADCNLPFREIDDDCLLLDYGGEDPAVVGAVSSGYIEVDFRSEMKKFDFKKLTVNDLIEILKLMDRNHFELSHGYKHA